MWSQKVRADWYATARCPKVGCESQNIPGAKPSINLNDDDTADCSQCGASWVVTRPPVEVVG